MNPPNARERVDNSNISSYSIRNIVLSLFRRRYSYGDGDVSELIPELERFGITTVKEFRLLMKKHRRTLLEDEEIKMPRAETLYLGKELGWEGIDTHANKSWFTIPGLVREAMVLEFGEKASVFED